MLSTIRTAVFVGFGLVAGMRFVFPPQQIGPPVALLAQVHAIRAPLKAIIQLLFLVERQAIVESPL